MAGAGVLGEPLAERLTATLNVEQSALLRGLSEGSLDFSLLSALVYEQAREAAPQIEEEHCVFTPSTSPGGFFFSFSIPPWNDARVRIALSRALDQDAILRETDPTGRGGWQSALAQLEPWALDPDDIVSAVYSRNSGRQRMGLVPSVRCTWRRSGVR